MWNLNAAKYIKFEEYQGVEYLIDWNEWIRQDLKYSRVAKDSKLKQYNFYKQHLYKKQEKKSLNYFIIYSGKLEYTLI